MIRNANTRFIRYANRFKLIRKFPCISSFFGMCTDSCEEKTYKIKSILGPVDHSEGPHWDSKEQVLYFVDISGCGVHRYDPNSVSHTSVTLDDTVGAVIPIKNNPGKFVIGYGTKIALLEWDGQSEDYNLQIKYEIDQDKPGNRFNDGKADVNGNVFIGTMGPKKPTGGFTELAGTLYRIIGNSKPEIAVVPVTISNGITWNCENTIMYYIDTTPRTIYSYDYNLSTACLSNGRIFFDFAEYDVPGEPDGMTIDVNDNIWVACHGGNRVIQVSKEGKLMRTIMLPTCLISSVVWGGSELDVLYVTTMKHGLSDEEIKEQSFAGCVFAVTGLGVNGLESNSANELLLKC